MIGPGLDDIAVIIKVIIGLGTAEVCQGKAVAKFDAFNGWYGKHHMAELAFDGVEEGVAYAGGKAGDHTFDDAADRIEVVLSGQDFSFHRSGLGLVEDGQRFFFQSLQGFCCFPDGIERLIGDAGQAQDMGADGNAVAGQDLGSHGPGKDQGRCQAAREMTAAAVVIEAAIAYLTGVIGMARPHKMPQLVVITGMLVTVADDSTQRRPRRIAVEKAALDFKGVLFGPGRRHRILPRCPPGHLSPDSIPVDGFARWQAIEDGTDRKAVGFTENRQADCLSKGIHIILPPPFGSCRLRPGNPARIPDTICGHIQHLRCATAGCSAGMQRPGPWRCGGRSSR